MTTNHADRLLLRPSEAAEVLGVGRSKLYELITDGVIPTVQVGHRMRVPVNALRAWIDAEISKARSGIAKALDVPEDTVWRTRGGMR